MSELQTPEEGTETPVEQPDPLAPKTTENKNTNPTETPAETLQEPAQTQTPHPGDPDYKQKFVESSKESILNAARIEAANQKLEQLTKTDTPTDAAMRQVYPEWDDLNDITKKALIRTEATAMQQKNLEAKLQADEDRRRLEAELDSVIEENSKLSGKENEFRRFARNPKNIGISADVLAKAFLFDVEPAPAPQQAPQEALPAGSGGPRDPLKPKKISIEEAAQIRKTDNNRYMALAKAGMIDDDIE
jgi:hypothetical protein